MLKETTNTKRSTENGDFAANDYLAHSEGLSGLMKDQWYLISKNFFCEDNIFSIEYVGSKSVSLNKMSTHVNIKHFFIKYIF